MSATNRCSRPGVGEAARQLREKSQALGEDAGRWVLYQVLSSQINPSTLHSGARTTAVQSMEEFPCPGCAGSDVRIHGLLRHFIIKEMGSPWGLCPGVFPQELLCHLVPEAH